jgi:hypothetical protein
MFLGNKRQRMSKINDTAAKMKRLIFDGSENYDDEQLQNNWRNLLRTGELKFRDYPKRDLE